MNAEDFNEKHGSGRIPVMVCGRLIDGQLVHFNTYMLESRMTDGEKDNLVIEVYLEDGRFTGWYPLQAKGDPVSLYIVVM